MSDPAVQKWKQAGHLYLWQYAGDRKDYRGWHMTADADGSRSMLALIDLMLAALYPSRREIRLAPAGKAVTNVVGYNAPLRSASSLVLVYAKGASSEEWSVMATGGRVTISAAEKSLKDFRAGIEAISQGQGDYAIGGEHPLWFWWHGREA